MPAKDPEVRRNVQRQWNRRAIKAGYGKWLYAKRKLVYQDAEEFQSVLELILSEEISTLDAARLVASRALSDSRKRQEKLGEWRKNLVTKQLSEREES